MSEPVFIRRPRPGPIAGFDVGILCLNTIHPLVRGNVQHAGSFNFPVLYDIVNDVTPAELMSGHKSALPPILKAVERLEHAGVKVIVGACGSFANYQKPAMAAAHVPVFMSILTQVPFLLSALPAAQMLGIIFASAKTFTHKVIQQCGITDIDRIVTIGADSLSTFAPILTQKTAFDSDALQVEITSLAEHTMREHPEIGAWLLQCSDLPPYAAAIQRATGLPVFDMCTLIEHLHRAMARTGY
jgi:hypothetical protein